MASMDDSMRTLAGKFVVFDGPDGSGKSTQFRRFAQHCRERGLAITEVREPGGTAIGEKIRQVLLDPANTSMSLRCEMMLYMASRAQLMDEVARPALERGELVLADRFISSTLAYQGAASGLPIDEIMAVGDVAIGRHWPDLVVIFDVDEATAARRMSGGSSQRRSGHATEQNLFADRLEARGMEYQKRVRQGFLAQAARDPEHYLVIDASGEADAVFAGMLEQICRHLAN
jgi:dTMP kinase